MASTIPSQERVVDPFASYNSNVVNRLTEIVTRSDEGMLTQGALQVIASDSTTVVAQTGYAVKDDVLIRLTQTHTVDFADEDQWESDIPTLGFPSGYYYIVLKYQYLKQRPAPQAEIKILKPSEGYLLDSTSTVYLLLKVAQISSGAITNLYDYDPGNTSRVRKYLKYYAGPETTLPVHEQVRDQARIAYEAERDAFFFGYANEWRQIQDGNTEIDISFIDATSIEVGDICYVNSSSYATLASAAANNTSADFVVRVINDDLTGRGVLVGYIEGVKVETGITISIGDKLYLSNTEAGKVTNVQSLPYFQSVGRALSAGDDSTPINCIFHPRALLQNTNSTRVTGQLSSWTLSGGLYYADVDVSDLGGDAYLCAWFDDSTNKEVVPSDVELSGTNVRVWFPINTLTINYIIQN